MNIVHLTKYTDERAGGIESVTSLMAHAGVLLGHSVTIVGGARCAGDFFKELEPSVQVLRLGQVGQLGPVPIYCSTSTLKPVLGGADVIHVHLPNPHFEALALYWQHTLELKGRMIPVAHTGILRQRLVASLWESTVQRQLLAKSERIIATAPQIFEAYSCFRGVKEKGFIMPYPCPEVGYQRLELKPDGVSLFALGRLVPYKGFETLIEALADLGDLKWNLTVAGEGWMRERLEALISRLGLTERVSLPGYLSQSEKEQAFQECDVFVMPSTTKAEAYGMVVTEAFAHGRAVLASDLDTGLAYLARGGECGGVVKAGDVAAWSLALRRLIQSPDKIRRAGEANRQFWNSHLKESHFMTQYARLISSGVERRLKARG